MKTALKIEVSRTDYSPEQVMNNRRTMTVGELLRVLQDFDEDDLIIISHDNGYTYGGIRDYDIDLIEIPEDGDEEIDEC